jgi:A/G-specific adenine glycosylase
MRISDVLLKWYETNKRELPWRNTKNPYNIWVSEIILQQTRVNQGYDYYYRFIKRFPDVTSLASASIDEVIKQWEGLGYYSRARNMHTAANQIVNDFNWQFPDNYNDLIKLKGVGEYTAAAIASIAYNQPVALVDGNVYRVISRVQGDFTPINSSAGKKQFFNLANEWLDHNNPGTFNQAIMEFGALQCTPQNPGCESCVIQQHCYAFKNNCVQQLPVKIKNKKIKTRYFYYFGIKHGKSVFIRQRKEKDIWQELYQFPLIEKDNPVSDQQIINEFKEYWQLEDFEIHHISKEHKHQLTHQLIKARFILMEIKTVPSEAINNYVRVSVRQLARYAFPRLVNILIDNYLTMYA